MNDDGQFELLPPARRPVRRAYVDFVFGLEYLSVNSTLLRLMHRAMSAYGLSCLLVNKSNIEQTVGAVKSGKLQPLVYLDLCSTPGNIFETLLQTMAGAGVHTLCDPRTLAWTYKA